MDFEKFEEDFDLTLVVGTSPTAQFQVDSRCMRRACKAWKYMLYGEFSERKPKDGEWVVSFPEDDIDSFRAVLYLIHGDAIRVKKEPDLNYLCSLLKFIDKWGLFQLFNPWREVWHNWLSSSQCPLKLTFPPSNNQGLFVAWTLGSRTLVAPIFETLVRHSHYDENNNFQLRLCEDSILNKDGHLDMEIIISKFSFSSF